jgi:CheY-like chemotaxis protein
MIKKNVLLVDDDKICNFINQKIIMATGMANNVNISLNGKEAMQTLDSAIAGKSVMPDVILLDLNMPIMNGFEFIRAYNKMVFPGKDEILIILVTSSIDHGDYQKVISMGVTNYLHKPITVEDIVRIITAEFEKTA